jgi:hypothetical protein
LFKVSAQFVAKGRRNWYQIKSFSWFAVGGAMCQGKAFNQGLY